MEGPTGYYSISKCSVKGRLMELNCMEHFPLLALLLMVVLRNMTWKCSSELLESRMLKYTCLVNVSCVYVCTGVPRMNQPKAFLICSITSFLNHP